MVRRRKKGTNRKVKNAVSTTYKGIKFRSKLELFTYRKLEEAGIKSEYEKNTFVLMDGFYFNGTSIEPKKDKTFVPNTVKTRAITYTPDFVDINRKWIIEVKGFANDVFPIKWKLFKKYLHDNGFEFVLFLPKNQRQVLETVEKIKELKK